VTLNEDLEGEVKAIFAEQWPVREKQVVRSDADLKLGREGAFACGGDNVLGQCEHQLRLAA
jgi:hypothetical protein